MAIELVFRSELTTTDPQQSPVLIIGQLKHLHALKYAEIKQKLEPFVTEEMYKNAVESLHPVPTDQWSLYLNYAHVAALPIKCSRHNTPSRAHAITRIVQHSSSNLQNIVMVCEKQNAFASACAIARAYPVFTRKTGQSGEEKCTLSVEFMLVERTLLSQQELQVIEEAATAVRLAAKIVDTPCNSLNVDHFLEYIIAVGKSLNIVPTIIRGEELATQGFGGIYGVGKAATVPPALAVLSHKPQGARTTVAWVGKGIVYDTGGLSIKGKTSMPGMKRDCGGAAAILGAFAVAVKSNFAQNLHAIFCLAENAVGPKATRPDDIHTLYSGRTVEINNTDAEGRLVLADGVTYAQRDLHANIIVDVATLTGAQGIATGKYHAAVLTNCAEWEQKVVEAGQVSGDLVFPIPYSPELHFVEFQSSVADMKNSVMDRNNAQSSCAGLFIKAHLGFDFSGIWIHVDMATPVHSGDRATGYGVALLTTLFGKMCKQSLLNDIGPNIDAQIPRQSLD